MRVFVVLLALLAGGKIWFQESAYRTATRDALVSAYGSRAAQSCQAQPAVDVRGVALTVGAIDWARNATIDYMVGNPNVPVYPWQVDSPLWDKRYKHAHLRLTSGDSMTRIVCDYDLVAGGATLSVM